MDMLSLIGVAIALGAILGGNALDGGHAGSLVQLTAFIVVIGGTLGAVMVQTPMRVFVRAIKMILWVVRPPDLDVGTTIAKIIRWSAISRKDGLLGLEQYSETEKDGFSRRCLQLLVDGSEPEAIRSIMELDLGNSERRDMAAAKVFESAGGYAPTIGILGAVMGLIHVMQNLSEPSKLGAGIAVAFVATIYGVGLANLILLPVANKLKSVVQAEAQYREMITEGIVAIASGENPRVIEHRLRGYFS